MDLDLSPGLRDFRDEVRTWLAEHLVGEFAEHRGAGSSWDDSAWNVRLAWDKELAAGRWLCIGWPEAYGGRDASVDEQLIFQLEYARADAPYRAGVQGQDLFGPTLLAFGNEEQKRRFLPKITSAEEFWGQGFSEPGSGSDLASLRTRAVLEGNEWVVDGQKIWASLGANADWFYVLCRTNPSAPRHSGISLLMVPVDQRGVDIRPIRNILGGSDFCEVFFSGARTSTDMLIGGLDQGWRVAMGTLGTERGTTLLAEQLRIQHEVDQMIARARSSGQGTRAVMRAELARAWSDARIMEWNGRRLMAALKCSRPGAAGQASAAKVFASIAHRRMGELGMRAMGAASELVGPGYQLDRLQRVMLGSRAESIFGGTTQIQLNLLAERALGLPREPQREPK
ncbi:acyl-CoA dehydrogenase [Mycobacterium colombiense]|uniref:acyl-CoA dehydrogenase family protein n=1 Tax=Mycobacterium colombiense TaxID=339268 RepID=UPI0007EF3486|nr:acyl-CoA dehydrogenase family protein [Mycobacterium colombiense]OBK68924.1 acyl-CoA dehydrogenase [Mycobacterium colombiense]